MNEQVQALKDLLERSLHTLDMHSNMARGLAKEIRLAIDYHPAGVTLKQSVKIRYGAS